MEPSSGRQQVTRRDFYRLRSLPPLLAAAVSWVVCCMPVWRTTFSEGRDRFAGARTVIILGYSLSGLLLFPAAKLNSPAAVIAALCVSVGALYFSEPAFWATAVHLSTPQNSLAESSQPQLHP